MQTVFEALMRKDPKTLVQIQHLKARLQMGVMTTALDQTSESMAALEVATVSALEAAHRLEEMLARRA